MSISGRLDEITARVVRAREGRITDRHMLLDVDVPAMLAAVRAVLDVCDRTEASIIPRGDFETGQKSVALTIRATIANALGEDTP